jgi:hypothetical protein
MTQTPVHPEFGDYVTDDAYDTEPPDPLQVAIRIHRYRRYLGQLSGNDPGDFFDMSESEQDEAVEVGEAIVEWVEDHEPSERAKLAREIHEIRRTAEVLPAWDDIPRDERKIAEAIASALSDWMIRQGAWR